MSRYKVIAPLQSRDKRHMERVAKEELLILADMDQRCYRSTDDTINRWTIPLRKSTPRQMNKQERVGIDLRDLLSSFHTERDSLRSEKLQFFILPREVIRRSRMRSNTPVHWNNQPHKFSRHSNLLDVREIRKSMGSILELTRASSPSKTFYQINRCLSKQ